MQNQPSPPSLSSQQRCCSSLITLVASSGFPVLPELGTPEVGAPCRGGPMGAEQRGRIPSLPPSGHAALGQPRTPRAPTGSAPAVHPPQPRVPPGWAGARTEQQQQEPLPPHSGAAAVASAARTVTQHVFPHGPAVPDSLHGKPREHAPVPSLPSPSRSPALTPRAGGREGGNGGGAGWMGLSFPAAAGCARREREAVAAALRVTGGGGASGRPVGNTALFSVVPACVPTGTLQYRH